MEEASWEPAKNLSNCQELLQEYLASHGEGASLPQPALALDEHSRCTTLARENASAESEAKEPASKRRQRRMKREGAAELRRRARLHPEKATSYSLL